MTFFVRLHINQLAHGVTGGATGDVADIFAGGKIIFVVFALNINVAETPIRIPRIHPVVIGGIVPEHWTGKRG